MKDKILLIGNYGNDKTVCDAARISFNNFGKEYTEEENDKLIKYMLTHEHTSPFEQVNFTFLVKAPIFIARQWMRHRTARINEQSGRYTMLNNQFFIPSNIRNEKGERLNEKTIETITNELKNFYENTYCLYCKLQQEGLARELSRIILPLGVYTEFIWQMDLHNLMHFLKLRLNKGAQFEIREYAEEILKLVEPICPITIKYFKKMI